MWISGLFFVDYRASFGESALVFAADCADQSTFRESSNGSLPYFAKQATSPSQMA